MVRDTSIYAYEDIKPVASERHGKIMTVLGMQVDATDREIAYFLAKEDPNFVRPRRNELLKAGKIELARKRECAISKKNVCAWRIV